MEKIRHFRRVEKKKNRIVKDLSNQDVNLELKYCLEHGFIHNGSVPVTGWYCVKKYRTIEMVKQALDYHMKYCKGINDTYRIAPELVYLLKDEKIVYKYDE